MEMDSDFSHDPADLARLLEARPRRRRPGARLALRARRRRHATGACCGASSARAARPTRAGARPEGARPDGRLQVLPPRGARGDPLRQRALAGLRLPGRADLPRGAGRASAWSRCRSSSATASTGRARCPGGSPPRRCGSCRAALRRQPRCSRAPAPADAERGWMPRPTRSPTACATRARRLRPGSARPAAPCSARWVAGSAARRRRPAARAVLARRLARSAATQQITRRCSRRSPSATSATCCSVLAQQHARARAARDGLRRGLHRRQLAAAAGRAPQRRSRAGCTSTAGGSRSPSSSCATTFSLSAQAYLIGHTLAGVSHFLRVSPGAAAARRAAARDPRADRAVPAAGRVDHRQPPRRVGAAAGGHLRDGRDRGAGARVAAFIEVYVSPHLFTALTHIHPPIVRNSRRLDRHGAADAGVDARLVSPSPRDNPCLHFV